MRKSKSLCSGCRDQRYQQEAGYQEGSIDAPVSGEGCWSFEGARVVNKKIYYSPNDITPTRKSGTLSCWHNSLGWGEIVK